MKKLIFRSLNLALVFALVFLCIPAKALESTMNQNSLIDTSDFEVKTTTTAGTIFEPESVMAYLPTGSTINEVYQSFSSHIVYVDYNLNMLRHIDEYLPDGSVRYNTIEDGILTTEYDGETQFTSLDFNSYHYSMEQDTLDELKVAISNGEPIESIEGLNVERINGKTYINSSLLSSNNAIQSRSSVSVFSSIEDFFPAYNAHQVASSSFYIDELGAYRSTYAYETQDYYTTVRANYTPFVFGTALTAISSALTLPTSAVEILLLAFDVLSNVQTLLSDIIFYDSSEIEYWFAVEGGVYDTTAEHAVVHVTTVEDWGTFTYGLNSNNEIEWYREQHDIPYSYSYHLTSNYYPILSSAATGYNNIIGMYGLWPWGVGTFGG
jgi:hypothetical protein